MATSTDHKALHYTHLSRLCRHHPLLQQPHRHWHHHPRAYLATLWLLPLAALLVALSVALLVALLAAVLVVLAARCKQNVP